MTSIVLSVGLQARAQRYVEARRRSGQAILEAVAELAAARAEAQHGEWGRWLAAVGLEESSAAVQLQIHEAAMSDPQFAGRLRSGWLNLATARELISAPANVRDQMLSKDEPPTRQEIRDAKRSNLAPAQGLISPSLKSSLQWLAENRYETDQVGAIWHVIPPTGGQLWEIQDDEQLIAMTAYLRDNPDVSLESLLTMLRRNGTAAEAAPLAVAAAEAVPQAVGPAEAAPLAVAAAEAAPLAVAAAEAAPLAAEAVRRPAAAVSFDPMRDVTSVDLSTLSRLGYDLIQRVSHGIATHYIFRDSAGDEVTLAAGEIPAFTTQLQQQAEHKIKSMLVAKNLPIGWQAGTMREGAVVSHAWRETYRGFETACKRHKTSKMALHQTNYINCPECQDSHHLRAAAPPDPLNEELAGPYPDRLTTDIVERALRVGITVLDRSYNDYFEEWEYLIQIPSFLLRHPTHPQQQKKFLNGVVELIKAAEEYLAEEQSDDDVNQAEEQAVELAAEQADAQYESASMLVDDLLVAIDSKNRSSARQIVWHLLIIVEGSEEKAREQARKWA